MNLGEIKTEVAELVAQTEPSYATNVDRFINRAIRRIEREFLKDTGTVKTFTPVVYGGGLGVGIQQVPLSDDHRLSSRTRLFVTDSAGAKTELKRIPFEYLTAPFRDRELGEIVDVTDATIQARPGYWAEHLRLAEIRRPADVDYTFTFEGLSYFPLMVADPDTNMLTVEAPDAVVFGGAAMCWLHFEDLGRFEFWWKQAGDQVALWRRGRMESATGAQSLVREAPG